MTHGQIQASDIQGWNSLDSIAASFEKRGLKRRPNVGPSDEVVLQLADNQFIKLVEAEPNESASDYKPDNLIQSTNLIATNDYSEFTFLTYDRDRRHGRQKHQRLSFTKEQMTSAGGEKRTLLEKLNRFEYGEIDAIQKLYDTRKVVEDFYEEFEELRTDLIDEVTGIPDGRDGAKEQYVQVIFDRLIFLYFIQEKRLLDTNQDYLHEMPAQVAGEDGDHYEEFYKPLFFNYLAEDKDDVADFGSLPYLNGGLFSKSQVEEEFEDARLGDEPETTNELFGDILDFLSDWNWHVAEHLDIADPKNLSPAILGHIFERTVNQKEMGAYYTPEEITSHMAEQTIHPNLLNQLNERVEIQYDEIDELFALSDVELTEGGGVAVADGGMTRQAPVTEVDTDHVETLYHDVLKDSKVLDPAVGSGAFLLAAQEVLLDIYLHCIEHFQTLVAENEVGKLSGETREELEAIKNRGGNETLYAKREIILNNLYGVDIDEGAVEICKLRLWLSMVADLEGEPSDVEPLPNIDFNIRSGDSLIGFESTEVAIDGQKLLITERLKEDLREYRNNIEAYKSAEKDISELRNELDDLHDEMQAQLNGWFADLPDVTVEDDISGAEDLCEIISTSNASVKFKLKFTDPIDDDLDRRLNDLGFRTWKKAANIELENDDVVAGKPEQIFDEIPRDELARSFVERGLLKEDIDQLDPFHWVMEFPEVYTDASDGFDVILENPPYVRIETIDELKRDLYKDLNQTAAGRCDLYVPFIERSYDLLVDSGRIAIITSNQFMVTDYGEKLRAYLPQEVGLYNLYDFNSYSAFDGLTIYTSILIGGSTPSDTIRCVSVRSQDAVSALLSNRFGEFDHDDLATFSLPTEFLGEDEWVILAEDERSAREQIEARCDQRLGADESRCTIGSPLKTGQDTTLRAEIVDSDDDEYAVENRRFSGQVEKGIWKKMIIPDDVERWVNPDPQDVIFFPYEEQNGSYSLIDESTFEKQYPKTYQKLSDHKERLESRKDSRRTWKELGRPWYSLAREGGPEYFERDKIVTDSIVDEPRFCIDTEGHLFASGGAATKGITPHGMDIYYLVGYLNSSAIYSYILPVAPPKSGGFISIDVEVIEDIPFYDADIDNQLCSEIEETIDTFESYSALYEALKSDGVGSIASDSEPANKVAANILREISRILVNENADISQEEQKTLEEINDLLVHEIFDLSPSEQEALERIGI